MKKVIIIGGGFVGAYAARKLEKKLDVMLIDTKDFFEFTPGILRTIVEPNKLKKLQIKHSEYLKKTEVVIGRATRVTEKEVSVGNKKYPFDYLIIAAGSSYGSRIKEQDVMLAARGEHMREAYDSVQNAKDIVIVGGGLVGVELAAEMATHCQSKNITIVQSGPVLIERNPQKSQRYVERFLRKNNVNIIFNEKITSKAGDFCFTEHGKRIKANVLFKCTGITPNSDFLKGFDSALDTRKFVKVNEHIQVNGFSNIFAPGDINNIQVEKTAQNAAHQAAIAVNNILLLEKGRNLRTYAPEKTPLCISLGKYSGVLEWGGFVLTGLFPALVKAVIELKEMFSLKH